MQLYSKDKDTKKYWKQYDFFNEGITATVQREAMNKADEVLLDSLLEGGTLAADSSCDVFHITLKIVTTYLEHVDKNKQSAYPMMWDGI